MRRRGQVVGVTSRTVYGFTEAGERIDELTGERTVELVDAALQAMREGADLVTTDEAIVALLEDVEDVESERRPVGPDQALLLTFRRVP